MFRLKRLAILSIAAVLVPLLALGEALAGGGFFSPNFPPGFTYHAVSDVTATIVLDPNGPVSTGAPATQTGTFGTIAITRAGVGTATAAFQVQPESTLGELRLGCNLNLTQARFVAISSDGTPGLPLGGPFTSNWLATDVTTKLFAQLGVTLIDPATATIMLIPGVTGVIQQQCAAFPNGNQVVGTVPLSQLVNALRVKPTTPTYPDRTIAGVTDPTLQWFPGFLVLQVTIGFWAAPGTPIP